jgi:hypothetical protein
MYNVAISGVLLTIVGAVGLVGNVFVMLVYTSPEQRILSTSIYLAALAASDFSMICTAMFLFVLETWRHHGPPILAYLYGSGAPYIFPLGAIFQVLCLYNLKIANYRQLRSISVLQLQLIVLLVLCCQKPSAKFVALQSEFLL